MITKISKIDDNIYQINQDEIPLDITSTRNLIESLGNKDINDIMDKIDTEGSMELVTAEKGSIVEIYEVDYTEGENIQKYIDKKKDLVSQDLFPGVESEDIDITILPKQNNLEPTKVSQLSERYWRRREKFHKRSWRQILSLQEEDFHIEKVEESDIPEILSLLHTIPQHTQETNKYIQDRVNWNKSIKVVDNQNQLIGFYLLGTNSITDPYILDETTKTKEDLSNYKDKKGLEGISLFVKPEYRSKGIASMLKDYIQGLGQDYTWGYQLKTLNNLSQWLKRRRLVAEDPESYITLNDNEKK